MTNLKTVPNTKTAPHRAALENVRTSLKAAFYERDDIIDGILAALLCQQHVLLLGPPGTAKSHLITTITEAIDGAHAFSWLLTKFTTPEEIFGPISLSALQQDRFSRIRSGKLPEAEIVFLDEIFKSNSAILNSLLTVVNERIFFDDGKAVPCPLQTLVGSSNELPESAELDALFDRFLIRFSVPYLSDMDKLRNLLTQPSHPVAQMAMDDLRTCQAEAADVHIPDAVVSAVITIKMKTEEKGFRSSDRRWKQIVSLLKAVAYLDGEDTVQEDHLDVLSDVLWREPKDRPTLASIVSAVGNPLNVRAAEIFDAAKEAVSSLGLIDSHNDKPEWIADAARVSSRLNDMRHELDTLAANNPKRKLHRLTQASGSIKAMEEDIRRRAANAFPGAL